MAVEAPRRKTNTTRLGLAPDARVPAKHPKDNDGFSVRIASGSVHGVTMDPDLLESEAQDLSRDGLNTQVCSDTQSCI